MEDRVYWRRNPPLFICQHKERRRAPVGWTTCGGRSGALTHSWDKLTSSLTSHISILQYILQRKRETDWRRRGELRWEKQRWRGKGTVEVWSEARRWIRELGQGKVLIRENAHKVFDIRLIQRGTLKMTSVSPPPSRFALCLLSMSGQEVRGVF